MAGGGDICITSTSRTTTIGHPMAGAWNVKCAEMIFDYSQVGSHASSNYALIGKLNVPAGSYILDIQVHGVSLWVSGSTAAIKIGDSDNATGFHASTNLKATDLLAGEANTMEHPGGLAGTYTASEQRVFYSASARTVIAQVTLAANATQVSQGETRVLVLYAPAPEESAKV